MALSAPLTICFDALGTCFNFDKAIEALETLMGDELRAAGSGSRMVIMDWFHSAQRDFVYESITSPPPPPISQILKCTLPRSLAFALNLRPSLTSSTIPDLQPVYNTLSNLGPSPGLGAGLRILKSLEPPAKVVLVTNGSEETTWGYLEQAGVKIMVNHVLSCDAVGKSKVFPEVYQAAVVVCERLEDSTRSVVARVKHQRWFLAAHLWDLHAARKHGFKTAYVLSEQPPVGITGSPSSDTDDFFKLYGGKPDVIGSDIEDAARQILEYGRQSDA